MKLIIGLGNVGSKYDGTRHNIGFEVLDELAKRFGDGQTKQKFQGRVEDAVVRSKDSLAGERATLLWPSTFMNLSGQAVAEAVSFYKLPATELLVICDDFHLPLGSLRFRPRGSSGGQRGLENIIQQLGTNEFHRLRVGVGPMPDRWNAADFVLGKFDKKLQEEVQLSIQTAADATRCWVLKGIEPAMNQYN